MRYNGTRTVVLEEHTLGVVYPFGDDFLELQILKSSVLAGSPYPDAGTVMFYPKRNNWRAATEQDFAKFNVVFHPHYLANCTL